MYGMRMWLWIAALLTLVLGLTLMLTSTGGNAWPLVLVWSGVALVCAAVELVARTKRIRVFVPTLIVFLSPVLAFEGGFFVLPAAFLMLVAAALSPDPEMGSRARPAG